jgi:hypothetical protein
MVLQDCVDSLRSDPVSCTETCLRSSDDGNEIVGIKVEKHPEPIQFQTIKMESEVCFVGVC